MVLNTATCVSLQGGRKYNREPPTSILNGKGTAAVEAWVRIAQSETIQLLLKPVMASFVYNCFSGGIRNKYQ